MNNIHIPPVVKNLLIINVIFFAGTWVLRNTGIQLEEHLSVFYFDSPYFKIWQPITYMFMHADISHIFFNMFGLFMFGGILEQRWGGKRFLNFYLITGLGAMAVQWGVQALQVYQITGHVINDLSTLQITKAIDIDKLRGIYTGPMLGASGAVFGVMTAFAMLFPNVELYLMFIPVPIKAKYFIPGYIVVELFLGVRSYSGDPVAHFAHLGGALAGFILVKLWKDNNRFYDYYE